ncbi:hypothetical protein Krac_2006 [Ktedonobacter racemifer DSM 44963]|uniref:Uncharacterized protein n=1 Tax=Ktedonobacter racemifer DSM 44963 TaxID=485913 RepID=D6U463_KTERA|nr:hypothetical protein Krac_2006 [Ktedonobacter racemifer DSM 44963]
MVFCWIYPGFIGYRAVTDRKTTLENIHSKISLFASFTVLNTLDAQTEALLFADRDESDTPFSRSKILSVVFLSVEQQFCSSFHA